MPRPNIPLPRRRPLSRQRPAPARPNALQRAALTDAAIEPVHRVYGIGGGYWARASVSAVDPARDPCHHPATIHACRRRGWLDVAPASREPLVHVATLTERGRAALVAGRGATP